MGTFGQPGEGGSQSQAFLCFQGGAPCRAYCGHQGRYEDEIDAKQAKGLRRAILTLCPWDGLQSWAQDLGLDGPGRGGRKVGTIVNFSLQIEWSLCVLCEDAFGCCAGAAASDTLDPAVFKTCSKCWIPRSGRTMGSPPHPHPRKQCPRALSGSLSLKVGTFLGRSHHTMAAVVGHAGSQLCPQGQLWAAHTVGALGEGGGHREPAPPLTQREKQVSPHTRGSPQLRGLPSRPLAPLKRSLPQLPPRAQRSGFRFAVPLPRRWSLPAACLHTSPAHALGMPLSVAISARSPAPQSSVTWALSLYSRTCLSTALLETVTPPPISPNPPSIPVLETATQRWPQDWISTQVA